MLQERLHYETLSQHLGKLGEDAGKMVHRVIDLTRPEDLEGKNVVSEEPAPLLSLLSPFMSPRASSPLFHITNLLIHVHDLTSASPLFSLGDQKCQCFVGVRGSCWRACTRRYSANTNIYCVLQEAQKDRKVKEP